MKNIEGKVKLCSQYLRAMATSLKMNYFGAYTSIENDLINTLKKIPKTGREELKQEYQRLNEKYQQRK